MLTVRDWSEVDRLVLMGGFDGGEILITAFDRRGRVLYEWCTNDEEAAYELAEKWQVAQNEKEAS